jgi:sulfotransferase
MERFHAIGGLPRSGSTLLCNILNQNPRFHASSTSGVAQAVLNTAAFMSGQAETRSALANDAAGTHQRFVAALRGIVRGWYADQREPVVFDKSRAWNVNALGLAQMFPSAKLIVMVRDPRAVFASVEKQHRKNSLLGADTVERRARSMFARGTGMIGSPIAGVEDILRRGADNVTLIKYESFVANPTVVLRNLYDSLGEVWYEHDLDHVENVATDLDALWLGKFPHEGHGKVEARPDDWQTYVSPDIATNIMREFRAFAGAFGYA